MRSRNQSRRPSKRFTRALEALSAECWGEKRTAELLGVSTRALGRWRAGERVSRQTMKQVLVLGAVAKVVDVRELAMYGEAKVRREVRERIEDDAREEG